MFISRSQAESMSSEILSDDENDSDDEHFEDFHQLGDVSKKRLRLVAISEAPNQLRFSEAPFKKQMETVISDCGQDGNSVSEVLRSVNPVETNDNSAAADLEKTSLCLELIEMDGRNHGHKNKEKRGPCCIGDKSTSDIVVRIRTQEGRDDWFYCHSCILVEKSKYFADRLSENWPTCQILDSRHCVEVHCQESEFDHHVALLRLLYSPVDSSVANKYHGVRNALGILQVAIELGCQQIVCECVGYLEAVPWEEAEEEEILRITPNLGEEAETILARLQPVNVTAITGVFLSAIRFSTSSPSLSMQDLKISAQEQLEYMLTEDDDAPLLAASSEIKSEARNCSRNLLTRFYALLGSFTCEPKKLVIDTDTLSALQSLLSDLAWACQILTKLEALREFVESWVEASEKILEAVERGALELRVLESMVKIIEVAAKVLEAIAYGTVILPTAKRLHMIKLWLPFVRTTKPLVDSVTDNDDNPPFKIEVELWQSLESAFVSILLALPSGDQADILTKWLNDEHIRYPDLTEAFEVWCYRSKVAKRRLEGIPGLTNSSSRASSYQSPSLSS